MQPNKKFQNNESQEVVTVVGDNGVFYNLSNGSNIAKGVFFQKFSEMLDTDNFFQSQSAAGLASLADQLKSVDSSKMQDIGGNIPPQVKYRQESVSEQVAAPAEYRDMLMKNFQQEQASRDLSQYKVYDNDDDAAADFERRMNQTQQQPQQRQRPQPYQDPYQPQQPVSEAYQAPQVESTQSSAYVSPEEEAFRFFRSFKKVFPITLSVDFDERIAEPNFIKMMAVNYEGDIIKFYTKEFMNRIYNDPGFLENKIYDKLRSLVFEEEKKKIRAPKKPTPPPSQIIVEGKDPKKKPREPKVRTIPENKG